MHEDSGKQNAGTVAADHSMFRVNLPIDSRLAV